MLMTTWRKILHTGSLFFGQTKLELFTHRDTAYVWRNNGEAYHPKNRVPTVKHGGGSCSASETGNLIKLEGLMEKEYVKILKKNKTKVQAVNRKTSYYLL